MTNTGGVGRFGSVFSVSTSGTGFQSLLSFSGTLGAYPGMEPWDSLTLSGTTLYGMTGQGGSSGDGNVFSLGTERDGLPKPAFLQRHRRGISRRRSRDKFDA